MYQMLERLFPICRSITGRGVSATLDIIAETIPLDVYDHSSGEKVFDWEVPHEWNINGGFISDRHGHRVADFSENNLHVVGYSERVAGWFSREEVANHIYTLPHKPKTIPYITSYYDRTWGFCMEHERFLAMQDSRYYVEIDASLEPGTLKYGEARLPGTSGKEILITSYICHPSMANDSLSGVVLAVKLYEELKNTERHHGYRFLFVPETIGTIVYLHKHKDEIKDWLYSGVVVTCVGDTGKFSYKKSRQGNSPIDRVAENVLRHSGEDYNVREFWPEGSDERQYCSPGFNLPVGSLMRSVYGEYDEYHTSDDNLQFVTQESLDVSLAIYIDLLEGLQINGIYENRKPMCEPHLRKYDLYPQQGNVHVNRKAELRNALWLLNYSDRHHSLIEIAEMMNISILELKSSISSLTTAGLLTRID
jgi:aminopeptidase-like protein